jgi:hypothetical protein
MPTMKSSLESVESLRTRQDELSLFALSATRKRTKPKCVTLENIIVLSETWRPVLDFLTSSHANIKSLSLGDLFELETPVEELDLDDDSDLSIDTKHLWFGESGPTKYGGPEMATCNSTVMRQDDAVRHRLDYHYDGDEVWELPLGWSERRLLKYGLI